MSTAWLAGEARGRSRRAPNQCLREHWTYLCDQGITVDWFMSDTGRSDLADDVGEPMPPGTPTQPVVVADIAEPDDVVAGRALRGTWVPLDLMGPSTGSLLLAVLDQPMTQAEAWQTTNRLRDQIRSRLDLPSRAQPDSRLIDVPLSATVRGRLVVAAAREGLDQPWDWIADN